MFSVKLMALFTKYFHIYYEFWMIKYEAIFKLKIFHAPNTYIFSYLNMLLKQYAKQKAISLCTLHSRHKMAKLRLHTQVIAFMTSP